MNAKIAVLIVSAAIVSTLAGFLPQQSLAATTDVSVVPNASTLANKAFDPDKATVAVGDTVTWTNKDTTLHTITSGTTPTADGKFDSAYTLLPGKTFSVVFNSTGDYPYFCKLHPTMIGMVTVGGSGGTSGGSMSTVMITATDSSGKSYNIASSSSAGVTAKSATITPGSKVTVTFDKAGNVTLSLPTSMISNITSVMSNGNNVTYTTVQSQTNSTYTTISFTIPSGQTSVDIMATNVVPEFPVVAIILIPAIVAVVAITRTKLNIFKGL
jgi:plastocyanin